MGAFWFILRMRFWRVGEEVGSGEGLCSQFILELSDVNGREF